MTERIDLDDMETADEQAEEEEAPNRGDWFWRGEGDPDDEPGGASRRSTDDDAGGRESAADATADTDADAGADPAPASPHVPSDSPGTPAGIPVSRGGGGAGEATGAGKSGSEADDAGDAADAGTRASGPHGGGADDMTTAFTYRAAKRLADPAAAFAEAEQWSDWIGIVGDVDAHVLGAFQRNETVDADFFNGSGTGPAERLADIDAHSMFYADRMVVVGVAGEDERVAEEAGWEFVPLTDAASGAGWELVPDEADATGEGADAGADTEDADDDAAGGAER